MRSSIAYNDTKNMYMYLHEINNGNTHEYDVTNLVAPQEAESVDPLGVTSL